MYYDKYTDTYDLFDESFDNDDFNYDESDDFYTEAPEFKFWDMKLQKYRDKYPEMTKAGYDIKALQKECELAFGSKLTNTTGRTLLRLINKIDHWLSKLSLVLQGVFLAGGAVTGGVLGTAVGGIGGGISVAAAYTLSSILSSLIIRVTSRLLIWGLEYAEYAVTKNCFNDIIKNTIIRRKSAEKSGNEGMIKQCDSIIKTAKAGLNSLIAAEDNVDEYGESVRLDPEAIIVIERAIFGGVSNDMKMYMESFDIENDIMNKDYCYNLINEYI